MRFHLLSYETAQASTEVYKTCRDLHKLHEGCIGLSGTTVKELTRLQSLGIEVPRLLVEKHLKTIIVRGDSEI